jgi:hypothetical protein
MPIHAVLTGDIVNSTQLEKSVEKALLKAMHQVMEPYKFEFYRGDSFQVYMKEPHKALQVALLCRSIAISLGQNETVSSSDIRISIGIGRIEAPVRTLGAAKGEAFILSGRSFDEMQKTATRLTISAENKTINTGMQVIADYINSIFKGMTAKQAEVIVELLKGQNQQKVTAILNKSKSTISQLVSAGRWTEIEKLLQQYETLINLMV